MILRLVKGLSYTTALFSVKKGETVNVNDNVGRTLVASGQFEVVSNFPKVIKEKPVIVIKPHKEEQENTPSIPDFSKMKVAELDTYAKEHNIQFPVGLLKGEKIQYLNDLISSI